MIRPIRRFTTTLILALLTAGSAVEAVSQEALPTPARPLAARPLTPTTAVTNEQEPTAPSVDVSPLRLDFGQQPVGSTSAVQTAIVKVGPVQIDRLSVLYSGDFVIDAGACGSKLKPNSSCALTLQFAPRQPRKTTASVVITTEPDTGPKTIFLAGEGVQPILSWTGYRTAWPALLVCLLFLFGILLVRWNMVARPARRLLEAHIDAVRAQAESLAFSDARETTRRQVLLLLASVEAEFVKPGRHSKDKTPSIRDAAEAAKPVPPKPRKQRAYFLDYVFWTRGEESAAWLGIHEAEELLSKILPIEAVRARMQAAEAQLRQVNSPPANAVADAINTTLVPPQSGQPAPSDDSQRGLLGEALGIVYDVADREYNELMSWQNKAVWLVGCGLLFIIVLAAASQQGALLLAGAVGGLLSRLSRSLQRANVPTDYGASWTTLFLSPVVGALAGWSGVLLVRLGVQLQVVGPIFNAQSDLTGTLVFGIAFLMGFSERAFNGVLSQLEGKTLAQTQAKTAQAEELKITTGRMLAAGTVGAPYAQKLTASGGTPPYRWVLGDGKLPDGLRVETSGAFSGAPAAAGTFTFTVQVTDSSGSKPKSREFNLSVSP